LRGSGREWSNYITCFGSSLKIGAASRCRATKRSSNLSPPPQRTLVKVSCQLDQNTDPAGVNVSDAKFKAVNLARHDFHGESNYTTGSKLRALER
jgi:hypothetical protein